MYVTSQESHVSWAYCILHKMCKLRIGCVNVQYLRKILLLSPMCNICTRFAQDCTSFSNAQYVCKICTRLCLFPQCAIYVQDCTYFSNVQYMRKFAQDCTYFCTYFLNAQYMHKICARLYLFLQCAIYAQDLHKIVLISPMCNICIRLQALLGEICHISHICCKFRMVFTSVLFLDCHQL